MGRVDKLDTSEEDYSTKSRYIELEGLNVDLRDSRYDLHHWIGYRDKNFEPREVEDRKLVDIFIQERIRAPDSLDRENGRNLEIVEIPGIIKDIFHIEGKYFKIFEKEWGKPPGDPHCFAPRYISGRLLWSESWNDVVGEIKNRGIEEMVYEIEEERKNALLEGETATINFKYFVGNSGDFVETPEIRKTGEKLRERDRRQEKYWENPPDIPIGC